MENRPIISFDYAIKTILRDKTNFDVLSGFLTELLGRDVTVLEILESESNKDDLKLKTNHVDLKARIDENELAIFEIQFATQVDFFGKVLYDTSKAIVEQVSIGGRYDVKKVYMISIAYFELGAKRDYLFTAKLSGFKGSHFDETIPFSQAYGLTPSQNSKVDIHPEYYLILPKMFDEQIRSRFDEWVYMLKKDTIKPDFNAAGIKAAWTKLDMLKMTAEERKAYERYHRAKTDDDTVIETALMEGKEEGRAEGRLEEKVKIAKNMKEKGMDADSISEITGLPVDEVLQIK